jgi:hypothetical protein
MPVAISGKWWIWILLYVSAKEGVLDMCSNSPDYVRIMSGLCPDLIFLPKAIKIIIPKILVILG